MPRRIPVLVASLAFVLALGACQEDRTASQPQPADQAPASQSQSPLETQSSGPATSSADAATPRNTRPSRRSSDFPERTSESDLFGKLLDGQVAGATLKPEDTFNKGPLSEIANPLFEADDYEVDPADCDQTGLDNLVVWADGSTDSDTIRLALGTGTDSPEKYQEHVRKCATSTVTMQGEQPVTNIIEQLPVPTLDGASDLIATKRDSAVEGSEFSTEKYLITGNVDGVNIVLVSSGTGGGEEPSFEAAMAIFKAQVDKLKE